MLRETGIVTDTVGNLARVQTKNKLACASCKVNDTCGNGIVEKFLSGKIFSCEIINSVNAKVGDTVIIEIPQSSITKASVIVYFIPLFCVISFAVIALLLEQTENIIIVAGLLGLMVGLLVTKYYNDKIINHEFYLPKMVSIVGTDRRADKSADKSADKRKPASETSIDVEIL